MNGTARTLFLKRLQSDYKNLWEASKLILDWTLFIYILIPGIAIGAFSTWNGCRVSPFY